MYPDLDLFPRWPGFEEDEELAGPQPSSEAGDSTSLAGQGGVGPKKTWSPEELAKMSVKQLGRLKSQGVDVGDLMTKRKKELLTRGYYVQKGKQEAETTSETHMQRDA